MIEKIILMLPEFIQRELIWFGNLSPLGFIALIALIIVTIIIVKRTLE